jgi:hypothetical protein
MLDRLARCDRDLVTIEDGDNAVLIAPNLQGRIFCRIGGELIHRLDADLMDRPRPDTFNNLGGNSLWPAPEGGPMAFNYMPGNAQWVVQDGIGRDKARVVATGAQCATIEKRITLTNRKGVRIDLRWERHVARLTLGADRAGGLRGIGYVSEDLLEQLGAYRPEDVLLAAWSLEQFPGGEGVTAFAKVDRPKDCINFDFYGQPESAPVYGQDGFTLALGGRKKFQIGVKVASGPRLLGALDRQRSLLMLRHTAPQAGRYFNIADNDQPQGPGSAADLYSVFSGGDLDFFELETIAPLHTDGHVVRASRLVSETRILAGPLDLLKGWLAQRHGINI